MYDIINLKEHDYKWNGTLYKKGKSIIKFITNHSHAHYISRNHSKLEILKIVNIRFVGYYLTFRQLLKVREALASMVSSDSWFGLKYKVESAYDIEEFQKV
jgi:hypothetical protein